MRHGKTVLFVNRWRGVIGPNVGLGQLVAACVGRGLGVHVAAPEIDEPARAIASLGASLHVLPDLELTPRSHNPLALARHGAAGWRAARRIGRLAGDVGAEVICFNTENMLIAPRAGRLAGCPVVVIMRGLRIADLGLAGRVYFGLQKRWVTRYVALAELGAELLTGKGVPRERIAVIPNGVDTERFSPGRREEGLLSELGLAGRGPVVGAVTHLTPRKGVHHLVEAAGRLRGRWPNLGFLVLGGTPSEEDAPYARQLRRRVEELGLAGRFILAGYRTDVAGLLRLFDLLAHPSETENCPRAVLEAQACGVPVVGFRVGGMGEVVEDGRTGLLVEPFDVSALAAAMEGLLRAPQRRAAFGQAARQLTLRKFDMAVNVARTVDLLVELAERGPRRPQAPLDQAGGAARCAS